MKITNLLNTYAKKATDVATEAYKNIPSIDLRKAIISKENPSEEIVENKVVVDSTPVPEHNWKQTLDKIRSTYSESVAKTDEVKQEAVEETKNIEEKKKPAMAEILKVLSDSLEAGRKNITEIAHSDKKIAENVEHNESLITNPKSDKTLKEKILSSDVASSALDYSVSALQKSGTIGRIVAVGAAREVLNKNPITHIASTAILGAARATLPENKVTKGILDISHEIVHGEIPKVENLEDSHKKKGFLGKYKKNLSNKTSIAFILGAIFMILIKKIL